MQEKVANIICKLLETPTFRHLLTKVEEHHVHEATGGWKVGSVATKEMAECLKTSGEGKPQFCL